MAGVSVQISGISKNYGAVAVVRDVSLDVAPGEFVALLGPSGSGKSTILMSVAGFTRPDTGTVRIAGKDVTDLPPRLRNVGMVFQKYALFPHMTVAQNIAFPLVQRGMDRSEIAHRIAAVAELVGLRGMERRPVPNLSGGQQQRVALARALVFQPPVLLMDEPLGALDKKMREHLQVEIKDIQRVTGTTVLFVTHDQAEALGMADRLLVLNHGRIEQVGTPEDLYNAPANAFVADFIGETNILKGAVAETGPSRCRVTLSSGATATGTPGPGAPLALGQAVDLIVRPNRIRILASGAADTVAGTVVSSSYFGESLSVRVRLAGDLVVTVKEPATVRRAAGEELALSWDSQDARVFPKSDFKQGV